MELASKEISGEQGALQLSPMDEVDDELEKITEKRKGHIPATWKKQMGRRGGFY